MVWLIVFPILAVVYLLFMSPWSQIFGKFPYKAKTKEKVIALTFDDGPNEPYTSELLDYLEQEKILATFFLVGNCAERWPKIASKIVKNGHVVGNHSQSHSFGTYFRPGKIVNEIKQCQEIIFNQTGIRPALFRTPWLWRNPMILKSINKIGLKPVGGEFCHSLEVFSASADTIANGALSKVKPGAIIIFHDGKEGSGGNRQNTIDAVKILVPKLKKMGYKFVTADKLLGITAYQK